MCEVRLWRGGDMLGILTVTVGAVSSTRQETIRVLVIANLWIRGNLSNSSPHELQRTKATKRGANREPLTATRGAIQSLQRTPCSVPVPRHTSYQALGNPRRTSPQDGGERNGVNLPIKNEASVVNFCGGCAGLGYRLWASQIMRFLAAFFSLIDVNYSHNRRLESCQCSSSRMGHWLYTPTGHLCAAQSVHCRTLVVHWLTAVTQPAIACCCPFASQSLPRNRFRLLISSCCNAHSSFPNLLQPTRSG